ncbi:MAG: hydroxysqualene dehydroxylase HpnE [Planctomycetota bacterium]
MTRVIVVGGGVAGIAAALRLSERGVAVTLLETRKKLGGRATSFLDQRSGEWVDNCQHVALGCCTNYLDLLERLGARDKIAFADELYWVEAGGRTTTMRASPLPVPGHLSPSFACARFLDPIDRVRVSSAMLALWSANRESIRERTFGDWLRARGQRRAAIDRFWEPVVISACNVSVERVDARVAAHVFQEGFLSHAEAWRMGVPTVPLLDLYDRAEEVIRAAGGDVRLGASVDSLGAESVTLSSGERLCGDRVICATPPERTVRLVDDGVRAHDPRFDAMANLTHSPIVGVHLVFDRPVLPTHSAVLVERSTQWVFRKDDEGKRLHAVISGADEWVSLDESAILDRVLGDIRACFPGADGAQLVSGRAVKEKRATFAPTPGSDVHRPTTEGPSGIVLAGCYVQTGWPATMEGAARSGYAAAAAALDEPAHDHVVRALRPAPIVRVLARGPLSKQGAAVG